MRDYSKLDELEKTTDSSITKWAINITKRVVQLEERITELETKEEKGN